MIQAKTNSYHLDHEKLYQDYRMALDFCRDSDGVLNNHNNSNGFPMTQWRRAYAENSVVNGTLTLPSGVGAPNVNANCTNNINGDETDKSGVLYKYLHARNSVLNSDRYQYTKALDSFTSPSANALFGSVRIQHGGDNRDLLLPATAIANFTDDTVNQIMLWATGEYASIQDRRLYHPAGNVFSKYDKSGIQVDAKTFIKNSAYYTFNKDTDNVERNTLLITQPMKRPLVQLGDPDNYWDNEGTSGNVWGDFQLHYYLYDDNEKEYAKEAGLQHITSPYNTTSATEGYQDELQILRDLEEDTNLISGTNGKYFNHGTNGYADVGLGSSRGLPAIITQMSSSKVGKESQINWVYSTTVTD
jgi:hypothetical protein